MTPFVYDAELEDRVKILECENIVLKNKLAHQKNNGVSGGLFAIIFIWLFLITIF